MSDLSQFPEPAKSAIQEWLDGDYDEQTKAEIKRLIVEDPSELQDAFSKTLSFGTGGMREIMGVGTNRMNIYTIQKATQGLANHLAQKRVSGKELSVVIGYDCRHHSQEFAHEAARTLAGNNIKAYVTAQLRPTPFVSFAARFKKASAAIMITASHNTSEYNGYKVYGKDGAQVVAPEDHDIVEEVERIKSRNQIRLSDASDSLIEILGEEVDIAYIEAIKRLQIHPRENAALGKKLQVAYTSLHGTGITLMEQALNSWGFSSIHLVPKQCEVDGDFPTVSKPNPEDIDALQLGIETLKETKSDLLIATDPDADRVGVVAMHKAKPIAFTGNQMACLCLHHILSSFSDLQIMPPKGAVITTIVTTPLFKEIASSFNVPCYETLTGFKYIGQRIHKWEKDSSGHSFLFGAEESYGYLFGTHARDKDALVSSCLISEIASFAKSQGKTLLQLLYELYETYGIYREGQISIAFEPHEKQRLPQLMEKLRHSPPTHLQDTAIVNIIDLMDDKTRPSTLPRSNVMIFECEDQSRFVIRPSGTEPKVKIYGMNYGPYAQDIQAKIDEIDNKQSAMLKEFKEYCLS